MIVGSIFYTLAIGNVVNVLTSMEGKGQQMQSKLDTITEFCKEARINKPLRDKLKSAIEFTSSKNLFSWIDK